MLLRDDDAIDAISAKFSGLELELSHLPTMPDVEKQQQALADALRYVGKRTDLMRYASRYADNLPIGSGATEGTCGQMQDRAKRKGQSWDNPGLCGILTLRGLALSDRWDIGWQCLAASHRIDVIPCA